jgi:hypothetical protein
MQSSAVPAIARPAGCHHQRFHGSLRGSGQSDDMTAASGEVEAMTSIRKVALAGAPGAAATMADGALAQDLRMTVASTHPSSTNSARISASVP